MIRILALLAATAVLCGFLRPEGSTDYIIVLTFAFIVTILAKVLDAPRAMR